MIFTRFCPAKVNLFLEISGKRPDGYHELATVFAKIDAGDWLTLAVEPAEQTSLSLQVSGPMGSRVPVTPQNLVCKAATAFLEHYGLNAHVQIALKKQIPTGAGLGGGSSDAAGVLLALCEFFHKDPMELIAVAAKLGADVPLFLYPHTFLKGEGIGEKLTPLSAKDPLPSLVLLYPSTVVSTRKVFSRVQLPPQSDILTNLSKLDKLVNVIQNGDCLDQWKPLLFNRLQEDVFSFAPAVKGAALSLQQANDFCMMSGSGSSVFTLVGTKQQAKELAAKLQNIRGWVRPVSFYRGPTYANYGNKSTSNE